MSVEIARVLTDQKEIQEAYRVYDNVVNGSGENVRAVIGRRGKSTDVSLAWHPEHGIWSYFNPNRNPNRFWCCYGTENPKLKRNLNITCQINIPIKGVDRGIAGAFARSTDGKILLLHSGKVGGGRTGIGKEAFLDFYKDAPLIDVRWPDGFITESLLIGDIGSPSLLGNIAEFVRIVDRFKDWAVSQ